MCCPGLYLLILQVLELTGFQCSSGINLMFLDHAHMLQHSTIYCTLESDKHSMVNADTSKTQTLLWSKTLPSPANTVMPKWLLLDLGGGSAVAEVWEHLFPYLGVSILSKEAFICTCTMGLGQGKGLRLGSHHCLQTRPLPSPSHSAIPRCLVPPPA